MAEKDAQLGSSVVKREEKRNGAETSLNSVIEAADDPPSGLFVSYLSLFFPVYAVRASSSSSPYLLSFT